MENDEDENEEEEEDEEEEEEPVDVEEEEENDEEEVKEEKMTIEDKKPKHKENEDLSSTIFVRNIHFDASEKDLKTFLKKFGVALYCRVRFLFPIPLLTIINLASQIKDHRCSIRYWIC